MPPSNPDRFLRINDVLERTGLSRATMYRKVSEGTFPSQVRIASRCVGWRESSVREWMQNPMYYEVERPLPKIVEARLEALRSRGDVDLTAISSKP